MDRRYPIIIGLAVVVLLATLAVSTPAAATPSNISNSSDVEWTVDFDNDTSLSIDTAGTYHGHPVVTSEGVYVGLGTGHVVKTTPNGTIDWVLATNASGTPDLEASPSGGVYALAANTGTPGSPGYGKLHNVSADGSFVWNYSGTGVNDAFGNMIGRTNGFITINNQDANNDNIVGVHPNGTEIFNQSLRSTTSSVQGTYALSDEVYYVTHDNQQSVLRGFNESGEILNTTISATVNAIEITGSYNQEHIYIVQGGGEGAGDRVWAYNTSGGLVWDAEVRDQVSTFAIPYGDEVLRPGTNGNITALDATTGNITWMFNATEGSEQINGTAGTQGMSPVTGADGTIYYGDKASRLYAINSNREVVYNINATSASQVDFSHHNYPAMGHGNVYYMVYESGSGASGDQARLVAVNAGQQIPAAASGYPMVASYGNSYYEAPQQNNTTTTPTPTPTPPAGTGSDVLFGLPVLLGAVMSVPYWVLGTGTLGLGGLVYYYMMKEEISYR